jgi:hypothetical protein
MACPTAMARTQREARSIAFAAPGYPGKVPEAS